MSSDLLRNISDPRAVHFVGIAGAGMSALAELLARDGVRVTGCDLNPSAADDLRAIGIDVLGGHDPAHVSGARVVVVSSAVPQNHPELEQARSTGIPVIKRAVALAEIVSSGKVIGIAGTHGKTTTTVMTTIALGAAGMDPTALAGGRVRDWHGNMKRGSRSLYVVESDEYDRSFLTLRPHTAIVTNVEADHLDTYRDLEEIESAFAQFVTPASYVIVCAEDRGASAIPASGDARRITYGLESGPSHADLIASDVSFEGAGSTFAVSWRGEKPLGAVALRVPGKHNILNALAAMAAGLVNGADAHKMSDGLATFRGVERRFDILGERAGITVVDDYAHHPTEVAATISAARNVFPGRRLVVAFQPHLFSRTRDFAGNFGAALAEADAVFLTDIYPAREKPIAGVNSALIAGALDETGGKAKLEWLGTRADLVPSLLSFLKRGDVLLAMGAGDISAGAHELFAKLESSR